MPMLTLLVGGVVVEDGQLALLVNREGREVEALVVGPGLHDVAHVPLADMHRVVARLLRGPLPA